MSEPVILIDAMNVIVRMHFSHRHLRDSSCFPTGVLHGVLNTIADLRESVSKRIVICWDHGIPVYGAQKPHNWRDDVVKGYKAGRTKDPDVWSTICKQLPKLHDALNLLGYQSVAVMGLEADDVIGILASELHEEVLIFSTDQDFYQLLDETRVDRNRTAVVDNGISILVPKKEKGKFARIYQSNVERKFGIPVCRWAEYLALGGDKSDNIKPVRGMGPKTAIKLIQSGVDLRRPFSLQPPEFQEKYGPSFEETGHGLMWGSIGRSYKAARLPRSRKDPRVAQLCQMMESVFSGYQSWANDSTERFCKQKFIEFCAEHDLNSLLALRHELFNTKGNSPCQHTEASPKTKRRA